MLQGADTKTKRTQKVENLHDVNWHSLEETALYKKLVTDKAGLDPEEAARRLDFYGQNALPVKEMPTIWNILLHQLKNPLIFILVAASVVSLIIGEIIDAIFIVAVIVLNSGLGAYQEFNAEKSAASLQNLLKIKARVKRGNKEYEVRSEEIVPGDIVLLESGYKVPADIRLLEANNLSSDESFLTGESIAATKHTDILSAGVGVSERSNMAFAGSTIMAGRGLGVVVSTGMNTEVGQIALHVNESESAKPPLVLRMERFTKQISALVLVVSVLLAVFMRIQGYDASSIFFLVVALAVSAIPEGLPVALTVALSVAVSRMSKRNVIVRKLPAVESLGSCTVIASDKTGTLTVNQQTVRKVILADGESFNISGQGYNGEGEVTTTDNDEISGRAKEQLKGLVKLAMLSNEGSLVFEDGDWVHYGDAMDVAVISMGYKLGINPQNLRVENQMLGIIPYESERKFSAAFYKSEERALVAAKGAVETIINHCSHMQLGDKILEIDKQKIEKQVEEMADQGYRVLAVAGGSCPDFVEKKAYHDDDLPVMVFYGLIGFIDPLRPEVVDSVNRCKEAGIKVIMITGDHPGTAQAIAKELGIAEKHEAVVTGQLLSEAGTADSPAFIELVSSTHVFARVSPTQKMEIVEVLINQGEFVAVTGDGVNDAPALRRANIGVAMGTGTDVAKEISSMIVTDDNFASIVSGVEEGRFAYDNVRKVIYLLISTGAAEVALFVASIFVGLPIPLLAVQLLWLNLVTNGIQDVALAFEGGEPDTMKKKPRKPDEKIFNPQMIKQTLLSGLTMGLIAFGFWYFLINIQMMGEYQARNLVLLLMVLMQNVHAFNCRSEFLSTFKVPVRRNYILILGVIAAQGIHILSMHLPFMQKILRVNSIGLFEWFEVLVFALPLLLVMELFKVVNRKLFVGKEK